MSNIVNLHCRWGLALSPFELRMLSKFHRLELCGKKGRTVSILLTDHLKKAMDYIVECRKHYPDMKGVPILMCSGLGRIHMSMAMM